MARPSADELDNLSRACQKLWSLDSGRLIPGREYEINVQSGKSVGGQDDVAGRPLFTRVDKSVFERPTFKLFYQLLDNYTSQTGQSDRLTNAEQKESESFLDAILQTAPMKYAHSYLVAKNAADQDVGSFRQQLYQMWFAEYNRDGQLDSSGFEHVFVGEHDIDKGEVSGLHNWVAYYLEESKGNIDYRGYIFPRRRDGPSVDGQDQMLTLQFAWKGQLKKLSSMFIGTSPEFEFALFSMCFLLGQESYEVEIERYDVVIKCYRIRSRNGDKIGTAYPELQAEDPTNAGAAASAIQEQARPARPAYGGNSQGGQQGQQGGGRGNQGSQGGSYQQQQHGQQQHGQQQQYGQGGGRRQDNDGAGVDNRRPGQGQSGNAWGGGRKQDADDHEQRRPSQGGSRRNDDDDGDDHRRPGQGYGQGGGRRNDDEVSHQRPGQGGGQSQGQSQNAWGRPTQPQGQSQGQGQGQNAWGGQAQGQSQGQGQSQNAWTGNRKHG